MEKDGRVLIIRRIHVSYRLHGVSSDKRESAERAHGLHADYCPVARSIRDAIDVTTSLDLVD